MMKIKTAIAIAALALASSAFAQSASPLMTRYADQGGVLSNFMVEQPQSYATGSHIFFTIIAAPGSRATVTMKTRNGLKDLTLSEVEPGRFEGSYTVKHFDDFYRASFSARADYRGRVGEAWAAPQGSQESWREGRRDDDRRREDERRRGPSIVCQNCGVISNIREVDEGSNEASAPGILMGGLVGGAIGNSVSGRRDRDAGTILGAIVGGAIGNEIAKNENRRRVWLIQVSLDNGHSQTFRNNVAPNASAGQRVRVENNQLVLDAR